MKVHIKVSVVVEKDSKVLLIREWSNKKNGYFWNLIKGTFGDHKNETLSDCVIREAKEEAGIAISIDRLLSCYVYASEIVGLQFNFLAQLKKGSIARVVGKKDQNKTGEDIIKTRWVAKKDALRMNPDSFISKRMYKVIEDWSQNKSYSLETLKSTG